MKILASDSLAFFTRYHCIVGISLKDDSFSNVNTIGKINPKTDAVTRATWFRKDESEDEVTFLSIAVTGNCH